VIRHKWDISPARAIALQQELAGEVQIRPLTGPVRTVAGADCAFLDGGRIRQHASGKRILAAAVLCDADTMEVLAAAHVVQPCRFPYIPGLLSFREAPAVIEAVRRLPRRPDLIMCDGQGIAHPRGLGLASHVALHLGLPTIGVAKSRLCGVHRTPGLQRRCRTSLYYDGAVVGAVVRTRTNVKPLFISVGHRVTLAQAVRWTLRCTRGLRLPEPTRRAHQHAARKKADLAR